PNNQFPQRRPDGKGDWLWNLNGVSRVLYRLPRLLAASSEETVFVAEGEKDVATLERLGLLATTNPGGAGKWRPEFNETLRDRHVVILPDNDPPRETHANHVARHLPRIAASLQILRMPDLPGKGDVSDWVAAGGDRDDLLGLVRRTGQYTAPAPATRACGRRPAAEIILDRMREIIRPAFRRGDRVFGPMN